MENRYISRKCKEFSPFVTCEIFKHLANKVKDYAVIQIASDPMDPYYVNFQMIEPLYFKMYSIPTCTWDINGEVKVVLVRMDDDLIMVGFDELAQIIASRCSK